MFLAEEESDKCSKLVSTVKANLFAMHAVRSAPSTSKPDDLCNEPEISSRPYDDYNPYGTYCTYGTQVTFKPVLTGLEIPEEMLAADRCVLERTKRDTERKRKNFAASSSNLRREGEGDQWKGGWGGGCFCSPRDSGDMQSERQRECSCTWVSRGILPLLCIDPSHAFDAISTFGDAGPATSDTDADTQTDTHSASSPDLKKIRETNASRVHSTHPPAEHAVLSQALGNVTYYLLYYLR